MPAVFVTPALYPDNPQIFVLDIERVVKLRGEANTAFHRNRRGETFWEIVIHTSGVDSNGDSLGPYWVDTYDTELTVDELVSNKIKDICEEIDWTKSSISEIDFQQQADEFPPVIYWQYPTPGQVDVPIDSVISIRLRDIPPAKGMDINTLIFKVDGFTVVPEVDGNKFDYVLTYKPQFSK